MLSVEKKDALFVNALLQNAFVPVSLLISTLQVPAKIASILVTTFSTKYLLCSKEIIKSAEAKCECTHKQVRATLI